MFQVPMSLRIISSLVGQMTKGKLFFFKERDNIGVCVGDGGTCQCSGPWPSLLSAHPFVNGGDTLSLRWRQKKQQQSNPDPDPFTHRHTQRGLTEFNLVGFYIPVMYQRNWMSSDRIFQFFPSASNWEEKGTKEVKISLVFLTHG